jgi:mono/diheme cytochrome c family protein
VPKVRASFLASVVVAVSALTAATAHGEDAAASFNASVKPLISAHCTDCHGEDLQKAGLRLDSLPADMHDDAVMANWVKVLDKLAAGEMPPKKKPRPPQKEIDAATQWLARELRAASLDRQQKRGRVVLRRLNATEYETTLRDLLGTQVELKDLLPEDNSSAGFDNVSAVLDLSATHLLRYQDAAERAVWSTIPIQPPNHFSETTTGREMTEKGPNFRQTLSRSCKLQGDALVFYAKLPRYGLCASAAVPTAGKYHVQLSACAVGEGVKSVAAAFMTVNRSGPEQPVIFDCRDIPAGKPSVIEFDVDLKRYQQFVLNYLNSWDIRGFKKPIEQYTGPGLMVEWIKIQGPIDAFPPPSYQTLFAGVPLKARSVVKAEAEGSRPPAISDKRSTDAWENDPLVPSSANPRQDAERLIRNFLPRAFRRPVSEELQRHFVDRVLAKLDQKYTFFDAMMFGYKSILCSPQFLFFTEPGSVTANADGDLPSAKLDDYALAGRLSYFLWSSLPDDELLAAAGKGELSKPAVLDAQVERMLNSPKAHRFTENFCGQWLDLRKMEATIPDPRLYGEFDETLLWSMPRETWAFFDEILRNNLSILEFVDSDWSMLNERLAAHYGIGGVEGNEFRKVTLPPGSHRGGVMTQASVLKVTADGTRTSPVLRGKWVLDRIVGKPPNPPPPDVPAIEPDIRGATTIRQQLDKHRNIASCAACHNYIDPPGFALENFDPIGGYREYYRVGAKTKRGPGKLPGIVDIRFFIGPDVEQGGQTPDGRTFHDIEDYKRILLEDKDQLARSLTQKLLIYATGADIQFADREVVEQIVADLRGKNYGVRTLMHDVVQSRVFLNK